MKTGDQVLFKRKRGNGIIDDIIAIATLSKYFHIGTVVKLDGNYFLLDISIDGNACLEPFDDAIYNEDYELLELKEPMLYEDEFYADLIDICNFKYMHLFGLFLVFINRTKWLPFKINFKGWDCSKLSSYLLNKYHCSKVQFHHNVYPSDFKNKEDFKELFV